MKLCSPQGNHLAQTGLKVARGIADWLCNIQGRWTDCNPAAGSMPFSAQNNGLETPASNWNYGFSIMALLSAAQAFDEPYYRQTALRYAGYLKTLQIFDPFHKQHYGAIREVTPQTPWCFTRDSLSAAWGFLELYRETDQEEYLQRAILWAEWFLREGLDEEGYPKFGVIFDEYFPQREPNIEPNVQGSFQGGCLNFLYQLGRETADAKWTGEVFINIADIFVNDIQQPSGFFLSICRDTKQPPEKDIYRDLHRANDDLGTLGLLCAYRVTGNTKYLASIEKFLQAVFASQHRDGNFENSIAPVPVVLNIVDEAGDLIDVPAITEDAVNRALQALYARRCEGIVASSMRGGLYEWADQPYITCVRSSCYALIYLLKRFAGSRSFLSGQ